MKFPLIPFSSKQFTIFGSEFVSDASDLDNRHLQKLYDDSCDVGLAIQSEKTGLIVRYYMDIAHTNDDGELTHWTYKPCEDCKYPLNVAFTTVRVFND